ncbi:MAG: hypothetical protein WBA06_01505 [Candidatus Aquilonibacter sp.]
MNVNIAPLLVAVAVGLSLASGSTQAFARASANTCAASAAYHALDFSIGAWSISVLGESTKGSSEIRRDIRGCAIVEEWKGQNDIGINVDAYNTEDKHWHRFFVDSYGKFHVFEGVAANGAIVYTGTSREADGRVFMHRLTLRSHGSNEMTQLWQKSADGKTWTTAFEGTYTRVR